MSIKNKFTVSLSKNLAMYLLFGAVFFLILPILFTVFQGKQHVLSYILFGGLAALFGGLGLRFKLYKVTVNENSIHVRKGFLKKFNLDVADISRVDWIVSFTKFGKNENITVRAGSRNFKVETLMNNSEKMIAYLKANVDESIIRTEIKNFSN